LQNLTAILARIKTDMVFGGTNHITHGHNQEKPFGCLPAKNHITTIYVQKPKKGLDAELLTQLNNSKSHACFFRPRPR
jgi:hypothetical protein